MLHGGLPGGHPHHRQCHHSSERARGGSLLRSAAATVAKNPREVIMFELKPLSKEAIPKALERADRYRLLNEPAEAESICLDMLEAEPDNRRALSTLILALTDQLDR